MKTFIAAAAVCAASISGFAAHAATVSGSHTTNGGKTVNLGGLEWLTWDETSGISRTSIEGGTGGFIADGWRYASRGELEALFDSLWGGSVEGWHASNLDGATWLQDNMALVSSTSYVYTNLFFGNDGECVANTSFSCYGHYANDKSAGRGWFEDRYGLSDGTSPGNDNNSTVKGATNLSSALVRDISAVPVPASVFLLAGALGGFAALRRRKKA